MATVKRSIWIEEETLNDIKNIALERSTGSTDTFNKLSTEIKTAEKCMAEIAVLKTHIINYAKTRDVYTAYRKTGYSKKFYEEHTADLLLYKVAKVAFDELNVKKLPTVKILQSEYDNLILQKKKAYGQYHSAKKEMQDILTAKANIDRLLGEDMAHQEKELIYRNIQKSNKLIKDWKAWVLSAIFNVSNIPRGNVHFICQFISRYSSCLADRTDYVKNPDKTNDGELLSSYEWDPRTVQGEFMLSKRQYDDITGRKQASNVIAYQIRQAFKPGEITPEFDNKIGYELGMSFNKGNHAFIVATHIDKAHIHNPIIFNSTSLDCTKKFRDFKRSGEVLAQISDRLCLEKGLSIIENPKRSKGHYGKWLGDKKTLSHSDKLRQAIDEVLAQKPLMRFYGLCRVQAMK